MFYLIFPNQHGDFMVLSEHKTIERAAKARQTSGELVCIRTNAGYEVVQEESWLFEWERGGAQDSYAVDMLRDGFTFPFNLERG